jgi:hypothetical protein
MLAKVFTPRLLAILVGLAGLLLAVIFGLRWYLTSDSLAERPLAAESIWLSTSDSLEAGFSEVSEIVKNLPRTAISKLDGRIYPAELIEQVVAVMIENHPAARPQMRGLPEASIVYETLAEGGITRFLAIFGYPDLKKVGPVRSARPYFVDWASEYGGAYVHAGGSHEALSQLAQAALFNLDEDGEIVYRDFSFVVPHNLFVDLGAVKDLLIEKKWQDRLSDEWFDFSATTPAEAVPATEISFDFSFPGYRVDYSFDSVDGDYARNLGGVTHTDQLSTPVRPMNIVVQFAGHRVLDEEGRLEMDDIGSGTAWYFSGGQYWAGRWTRLRGGRTQFFDAAGQLVSLAPGQTFIEVIADTERVEWR